MPKNIRPICVKGNIAYVPLTRGYVAIIDAADAPLVQGKNWYAHVAGNTVYGAASNGKNKKILLHRMLMNPLSDMSVDHKNGDGLDNRRSNLRIATHAQNMANRKKAKHGRSPFKGVTYDPGNNRTKAIWRAVLRVNGKRYRGPRRRCHFRAAMDYDELSRTHHKDFSRRNCKKTPPTEADGAVWGEKR